MAQLEGQGLVEMQHHTKMAQLEGRGIQEMEQQPTEMPAQGWLQGGRGQNARHEMEGNYQY